MCVCVIEREGETEERGGRERRKKEEGGEVRERVRTEMSCGYQVVTFKKLLKCRHMV